MFPFDFDLSSILLKIPAVIIAFAFHEWAHAMAADYFGDPTPRSQGRLSLNPFVHLDPIGTALAIFFTFGWAKPVQTRPSFFRGNKVWADVWVSAAGVLMNFVIALVTGVAYFLLKDNITDENIQVIVAILFMISLYNVAIGFFNLIPLPGLDGFHILVDLLPAELGASLSRLNQYGMIIFMLVIITGVVGMVLTPLIRISLQLFEIIATGILRIFGVG